MTKKDIITELEDRGAQFKKSDDKDTLEALLNKLNADAAADETQAQEPEVTSDTESVTDASTVEVEEQPTAEVEVKPEEKAEPEIKEPEAPGVSEEAREAVAEKVKEVRSEQELIAEKVAAGLTQEQAADIVARQKERDAE